MIAEREEEIKRQRIAQTYKNRIEELEKQVKQIELSHKKHSIELENQLKSEQIRAEELYQSLLKNITEQGDYQDVKFMNSHLQKKLEEYEEYFINARQNDCCLKKKQRQAHQKENINISPYQKESKASNQSDSSKNGESPPNKWPYISEDIAELSDMNKRDLIQIVIELKSELDQASSESLKIREGAIDAIVEKERIIFELREELEMKISENEYFQQRCQQLEIQKEEQELSQSKLIESYEKMFLEQEQKLASDQIQFEERIKILEKGINKRAENFQLLNKGSTKDSEQISQLTQQIESLGHDNQVLKDEQKQNRLIKEKLKELQEEISANCKKSKKELDIGQSTIDKLRKKQEDLVKNNMKLEDINQTLQNQLDASAIQISQLQFSIQELSQKQEELLQDKEREINQLQQEIFKQQKQGYNLHEIQNDSDIAQTATRVSTADNAKSLAEFGVCFYTPSNNKSRSLNTDSSQDDSFYEIKDVILETPIHKRKRQYLQEITNTADNCKGQLNIHALNQSLPSKSSKVNNIFIHLNNKKENSSQGKSNIFLESHMPEIQLSQFEEELKNAFKQIQETRKALSDIIAVSKERESSLKCENEFLKSHIHKLETHMMTYKLQCEEDNSYHNEELKIAESIAADSKLKVDQMQNERDTLQSKYYKLLTLYNIHTAIPPNFID